MSTERRTATILDLTISIAAYNDAGTVESVIRESLAVAAEFTDRFEVLVIDDGSRDDTPEILDRVARECPRVRVVRHAKNLGFGPTICEAYTAPESHWVLYLPGDAQIPASQLRRLATLTDRCHFILGHRKLRRDPLGRRIASRTYNFLIGLAARRRIRDVNSVALVQPRLLRPLSVGQQSAFVHAELMLEAIRAGQFVGDVEIEHRPRMYGSGSGNRPSVIWATFRDYCRYCLRHLRGGQAAATQPLGPPLRRKGEANP